MQAVITRPVHGAHRDQVRGADPTGLCTDPGGPGARYCIDAFIAQGVTNFGFKTDDHVGPKSDGGTYRFELTFRREQNGNVSYEAKRGTSVPDFLGVHLEEPAELIRCDAMGGSSSIVAGWQASRYRCAGDEHRALALATRRAPISGRHDPHLWK